MSHSAHLDCSRDRLFFHPIYLLGLSLRLNLHLVFNFLCTPESAGEHWLVDRSVRYIKFYYYYYYYYSYCLLKPPYKCRFYQYGIRGLKIISFTHFIFYTYCCYSIAYVFVLGVFYWWEKDWAWYKIRPLSRKDPGVATISKTLHRMCKNK